MVAAPDHHLVISGDRTFLVDGPRENGFRPAIETIAPDHVVPATSMGRLLDDLARTKVDGAPAAGRDLTLVADPLEPLPHGGDLAGRECGDAVQESDVAEEGPGDVVTAPEPVSGVSR